MWNLIKIGIPLGLKYTKLKIPKKSTKKRGLSDHSSRSNDINMYQDPADTAADIEINLGDTDDLASDIGQISDNENSRPRSSVPNFSDEGEISSDSDISVVENSDQTRSVKRRRVQIDNVDDSSSSHAESGSDSESETDGYGHSNHDGSDANDNTIDKWRFDPLAGASKNDWHLSSGQQNYVNKFFTDYVGDTALRKTVRKRNPKPTHSVLKALPLDQDMVGLLPSQAKSPVNSTDGGMRRIQGVLLDVMGPLGKLWAQLEKIMDSGKKSCKVDKLLKLAEQSVLLVGQTNVIINYNRRLNVLSRFLKNPKAAHEILKQNEQTLKTNKTTLFGPGFYKALHRRAKGTKQSREIRQHLAPSYSHKIKSSHRGGFSGSSRRPFRRGPSSKTNERGAGTAKYRGNRGGKRGGSRYVSFYYKTVTRSQDPNPTNKTHRIVPKIKCARNTNKGSNTHTSCSDGSDKYSRSRSSRGQDSSLFGKLETNNYRSKCPSDSKRVSDRICKSANTINTHGKPKVRGGRVTKHRHRSTNNARKGSYRKGQPHCGAICGTRFLTTQEKRNIQIGIQSETTEPIYSVQTFQNGEYDHADDHDTASGLDDDNRLTRRVSLSSNALGSSKVSEVHVEGTTVPVYLRPIWIEPSPKGVYKTPQAGHGNSKKVRSENTHFSGRSQQTHHVETTLCECGILVTLFSTWYQRGNHVIACLVYDLYNNMAK